MRGLEVADELAEAGRLERGRVVGALPRAVLGEVALEPRRAERVRGDVDRDAEVVAREADELHAVLVRLVQISDLEHAHVLERHGVARRAVVEHDALRLALLLPELHDALDLLARRHARRDVHVARVLVAQHRLHLEVLVRRRADLDEVRLERHDLLRRRRVPHRARVPEAELVAVRLELAVLLDAELEELAVLAVRLAVRVARVRVRRVVLLLREQLLRVALLELGVVRALQVRDLEQVLRDRHVALARARATHTHTRA